MPNPKGTTTIGIPITNSKEDRDFLRKLDAMKTKRGHRARTSYIRQIVLEDHAANAKA